MALTKSHTYTDSDGDTIRVSEAAVWCGAGVVAILQTTDSEDDESASACINAADSVPLALNVLGHDRPEDDPMEVTVSVGSAVVQIARTPTIRDFQLDHAAALLKAVDAYDQRAIRLTTAEKRREAAAQSLTAAVIRLRNDGPGPFTGDEIGKLREALGRFDAALAN